MPKFYLFWFSFFCVSIPIQQIKAQDTTFIRKDSAVIENSDSILLNMFKDSIDNLIPVKSYFQASISYLNNNVYMGRKDSMATPYITPSFGYYHKSGFYINASASYLNYTGENRIDLVTMEAGYMIKAGKFEGQASASKYWYNSNSYNVRSEITGNLSFYAAVDLGPIKPTFTPMLNFGEKTDFAMSFGLEHSFFLLKDALSITPMVNANGSTENFYNSYYKKKKFTRVVKGVVTHPTGYVSSEVLDASQFKLLDYEFSLPFNYTIKKFTFNISPVYAIPIDPALTAVTTKVGTAAPKTKITTEVVSNSFYFQAFVIFKF